MRKPTAKLFQKDLPLENLTISVNPTNVIFIFTGIPIFYFFFFKVTLKMQERKNLDLVKNDSRGDMNVQVPLEFLARFFILEKLGKVIKKTKKKFNFLKFLHLNSKFHFLFQ